MTHKAGTCSKFDIVTSRIRIKQLFSLCTLHVVGSNERGDKSLSVPQIVGELLGVRGGGGGHGHTE